METVTYVARITGRTAEDWAEAVRSAGAEPPPDQERCLSTLALFRQPGGEEYARIGSGPAPFAPWGVQIAGNFSKAVALAAFDRVRSRYAGIIGDLRPMIIGTRMRSRGRRPFYRVRLPAPTRQAANDLCERLRAAQGNCVVLKS